MTPEMENGKLLVVPKRKNFLTNISWLLAYSNRNCLLNLPNEIENIWFGKQKEMYQIIDDESLFTLPVVIYFRYALSQ